MSALIDAIDLDAYQWLSQQAPHFLQAIELELEAGRTPTDIRVIVQAGVGPERQGLALRCQQAARHIRRANGN